MNNSTKANYIQEVILRIKIYIIFSYLQISNTPKEISKGLIYILYIFTLKLFLHIIVSVNIMYVNNLYHIQQN